MVPREVIITCAVTGAGDGPTRSPHVPVLPEDIADDCLRAADAGAAIVHVHVRDPETGAPSRDVALYERVVERIRSRNPEVIINLSGGMGGALEFGPADAPLPLDERTDFVGPDARMEHTVTLKPELASLDSGSLNFGDVVYATTPTWLETMAHAYRSAGVRPEIEVFELGHIEIAKDLIKQGAITTPALFGICLGVTYGAPATPEVLLTMRDALPDGSHWSAFGLSSRQLPLVGLSVLLGGHVRVGLEDNLYLSKGRLARNEELVMRARAVIEALGCRCMSSAGAREFLELGS